MTVFNNTPFTSWVNQPLSYWTPIEIYIPSWTTYGVISKRVISGIDSERVISGVTSENAVSRGIGSFLEPKHNI